MMSQSEFVELVARLREKQREFFATRLPPSRARLLAESRKLEAEVDEAVKEHRRTSPPGQLGQEASGQKRADRPVEGECEYGSNRH